MVFDDDQENVIRKSFIFEFSNITILDNTQSNVIYCNYLVVRTYYLGKMDSDGHNGVNLMITQVMRYEEIPNVISNTIPNECSFGNL